MKKDLMKSGICVRKLCSTTGWWQNRWLAPKIHITNYRNVIEYPFSRYQLISFSMQSQKLIWMVRVFRFAKSTKLKSPSFAAYHMPWKSIDPPVITLIKCSSNIHIPFFSPLICQHSSANGFQCMEYNWQRSQQFPLIELKSYSCWMSAQKVNLIKSWWEHVCIN